MKIPKGGRMTGAPAAPHQLPATVLKPYTARPARSWRIAGWIAVSVLTVACVINGFYYALTTPFLLKEFLAPLVPLGCLAIWALPESKTPPTRALEFLFWAFLFATMLWPNYLAVALPGLPWISAVRLVGLPLAIVLMVRLSTSRTFVAQIKGAVQSIPRLGTFMACFVAIQIFSVIISDKPFVSADAVFDNQIGWTAIFFVSCYIFLRPGAAQRWAAAFCICAVGLSFLGLWEMRLEQVPWADHVPSFFAIEDESVQRVLAGARRLGTGDYRVQGPQSTSLGFAEFLALATPFLIHYMAGAYRLAVRLAAGVALPLVFYVILATHARLGVVGFMLGCLLYLLVWSLKRWNQVKGSILGPAIVVGYPMIFFGILAGSLVIGRLRKIVWGNSETAASNQGRLEQLKAGLPMVLQRPWGYGAGRGADKLGFTDPGGFMTIDNYFLLVALDWGILGFIFYYGMILMTIWNAGRYGLAPSVRRREHALLFPVGIALTEFFVIKTIFSQTHNHKLQFMMMGMVVALIYRVRYGVPGDELPAMPSQSRLSTTPGLGK
jgi:hypothetical protein